MKRMIILFTALMGVVSLLNAQSGIDKDIQGRIEKFQKDFSKNFEGKELPDLKSFDFENPEEFKKKIEEWQTDISKLTEEQIKEWRKKAENYTREYAMNMPEFSGKFSFGLPELHSPDTQAKDKKETQQDNDELFKKLSDIKGVEVVYISKSLLGMVAGMDMPQMQMNGIDIKKITGKLESLQVFSSEDSNAMKKLKSESDKLIKNGKYETLMFVKDEESKTVFYMNKLSNQKSEMLMISEEPSETTLIRFTGSFTLKDLQDMTKNHKK